MGEADIRMITSLLRYVNPNASPYVYPQQQWNAYEQPIAPARPYPPQLPGFGPPMRRGPTTPLERENHEHQTEKERARAAR
ncbi:hypothetical protein E2P81_ATG11993 [Venturia nashicola]|uniref:Uncharacterized protein n=1 Tax=Venturia nashicola TaxID=86259 RepID=A0A4Z1NLR3_9PEZI|nr:hypothetical protein E6O75_ATG11688 [Venturia nashicola]TLD24657.1 hypothetical protein E2P81_ATG11993 [Venturia nashicola]